jgi:6-pyruvoyltetrahydropterin/6-carboxytetrahydropterin synthase
MVDQLLYTAVAGFEAARQVTLLPGSQRFRRLHGHSFLARVRTPLPDGWAGFPGGEVSKLQQWLARAVGPLDY